MWRCLIRMQQQHSLTYFPKSQTYFEGEHKEKPEYGHVAFRDGSSNETVLTSPNLKTASQQLKAGVANSENVDNLRYVKLFSEVAAMPMPYFFLEPAFTKRTADSLELDESFRSVDDDVDYPTGRLEESDQTLMNYAKVRLGAKKMKKVISVPIEDEIRSQFDMMSLEMDNLRFAFSKRRNELALDTIKKITHNVTGGTALESLSDLDTVTDGNYHSDEDPVKEIQAQMTAYTQANALPITSIVLSSANWTKITRNTWVRGQGPYGLEPERLPIGSASKQFPGLDGVSAIVDISVPDDRMYFLTKDALRLIEGPKMQVAYPDYNKDSQQVKILDFVGFESVDDLLKGDKRTHIGGRVFSFAMSVS